MNKSELINKVAKDARLTRGEAGIAIEATIESDRFIVERQCCS